MKRYRAGGTEPRMYEDDAGPWVRRSDAVKQLTELRGRVESVLEALDRMQRTEQKGPAE